MVLAAGASLLFPDYYKLIIDAGTCVTYDYIDDKNVYHGGAISPGTNLDMSHCIIILQNCLC
jgi:type III pantothenate kinase